MSRKSAFKEWFKSHEWWHENSRLQDMASVWNELKNHGLSDASIVRVMDQMIGAMCDEYGN